MIRFHCDECHEAIDAEDSHIEIPRLIIIKNHRAAQISNVHFCDEDCLHKWFKDNSHPPSIIGPS